jgi:hypothetical protein
MKKTFAIWFVLCLVSAGGMLAAVPQQINYQGYLTDTSGNALDTTVAMTFKLCTDPTAGSLLWIESWPSVTVTDGLFNVRLGQIAALVDSVFNRAQVWLGITVGYNSEMVPRSRIVSAAYAYRVGTVDGASGGSISGNLAVGGKASIGPNNSNAGTNAFVVGQSNSASGNNSSVTGGMFNTAAGYLSFIGGGDEHEVNNQRGVICGGYNNTVSGDNSVVAGGESNAITAAASVIGGGGNNSITQQYAVVGGGRHNSARGQFSVVAGGGGFAAADSNSAIGQQAAIGGGKRNLASDYCAVVSGGFGNTASEYYATVCGGYENAATEMTSTVAGGQSNRATGQQSFAAGYRARANHYGAFVWGSSTSNTDSTASFGNLTFTVRCVGGARFYTANTGTSTGVELSAGGGSWSNLCDVRQKRLHGEVNTADILAKIAQLPLHRWSYKTQDESIQHIGPTAQDFYAAFSLGESDTTINTLDPDGIALAAIQELKIRTDEIEQLKKELNDLRHLVEQMAAKQQDSNSGKAVSAAFIPKTHEPTLKEITR